MFKFRHTSDTDRSFLCVDYGIKIPVIKKEVLVGPLPSIPQMNKYHLCSRVIHGKESADLNYLPYIDEEHRKLNYDLYYIKLI